MNHLVKKSTSDKSTTTTNPLTRAIFALSMLLIYQSVIKIKLNCVITVKRHTASISVCSSLVLAGIVL